MMTKARKSRRSHKNSRDGCPNCKAKRIKCSEDLPQCNNCVKKKLRCGYLDFPEDKLQKLRKKHEKILQNYDDDDNDDDDDDNNNNNNNNNSNDNNDNDIKNHKFDKEVEFKPNQQPLVPSVKKEDNFMFELPTDSPYMTPGFFDETGGHIHFYDPQITHYNYSDSSVDPSLPLQDDIYKVGIPDSFELINSISHQDFANSRDYFRTATYANSVNHFFDNNSKQSKVDFGQSNGHYPMINDSNIDYNNNLINFDFTSNQFGNYDKNNNYSLQNDYFPSKFIDPKHPPLPNAVQDNYVFPKLKKSITAESMDDLQYIFSPTYNHQLIKRIWNVIFLNCFDIDVYYAFFYDKSLNTLLNNLQTTLSSDYLRSIHNTFHTLSYNSEVEQDFFLNDDTLKTLLKKSHFHYSDLMKIFKTKTRATGLQHCIAISYISTYASLFEMKPSMHTYLTMSLGTASLIQKAIDETYDVNKIPVCIKTIIDINSFHCKSAIIPDLDYSILYRIASEFETFKDFLINSTTLYQDLESSTNIRDFLPKHECIEMKNFFDFLFTEFIPKSNSINNTYNKFDDSLRTISLPLYYEMISKWYKVLPAMSMTIGSNIIPFQKVFYLFFTAMSKSLEQVFSPVNSVFLLDFTSVMFPEADFCAKNYIIERNGLNEFQYNYMTTISRNLLRLISYLNYRKMFYNYKLINNQLITNNNYLRVDNNTGITQILPQKLSVKEKCPTLGIHCDFDIKFENFPQFDEFTNYPPHVKQCSNGDHQFNYDYGLYNDDYNPTKLLSSFISSQKLKWQSNPMTMDDYKLKVEKFYASRAEVSKLM